MFNFNFEHILKSLLPQFITSFWYDFIWCILRPINLVKYNFSTFRTDSLKNMSSCQVQYLEFILNDYFDQSEPELIYIDDIDITEDQVYVGTSNELCDIYLSTTSEDVPVYINTIAEIPQGGFRVNVFEDFYNAIMASGDINKMHKLIRKHKAAGFNYVIEMYQIT